MEKNAWQPAAAATCPAHLLPSIHSQADQPRAAAVQLITVDGPKHLNLIYPRPRETKRIVNVSALPRGIHNVILVALLCSAAACQQLLLQALQCRQQAAPAGLQCRHGVVSRVAAAHQLLHMGVVQPG
jgi:hypothetical protein